MNRDVADLSARLKRVEELLAQAVPLIAEGHVYAEPAIGGGTRNVCASCNYNYAHSAVCPMQKLLELVKGFQG